MAEEWKEKRVEQGPVLPACASGLTWRRHLSVSLDNRAMEGLDCRARQLSCILRTTAAIQLCWHN